MKKWHSWQKAHIRRYPIWQTLEKCKLKPQDYLFTSTRLSIIKKKTITGVEGLENSYSSVAMYNSTTTLENSLQFCKNLNIWYHMILPFQSEASPKRNESLQEKNLYRNVHSSVMCNSPKLENNLTIDEDLNRSTNCCIPYSVI